MNDPKTQEQTDDIIIKQVFDTFANEFFSRRGKVCREGWDCLFMAMNLVARKQEEEQ